MEMLLTYTKLRLSTLAVIISLGASVSSSYRQQQHEKYSALFPRKAIVAALDIEERDLKNLERKWYEMTGFPDNSIHSHRRSYYNVTDHITTRPEEKSSFYYDCLHDSRTHYKMREYPDDDCYSKNHLQNIFFPWWYYYGTDISYSFDFILWDHNERTKVNSFWYLTLYLKLLLIFTDNPVNIATLSVYGKRKINFEEKIHDILRRKTLYDSRRDKMVQVFGDNMNKISDTVTKFNADMLTLRNKINGVIEDVSRYENQRRVIEDKIKEIGKQASSTRQAISWFSEENIKRWSSSWKGNVKLKGLGNTGLGMTSGFENRDGLGRPTQDYIKFKHTTFPDHIKSLKYSDLTRFSDPLKDVYQINDAINDPRQS